MVPYADSLLFGISVSFAYWCSTVFYCLLMFYGIFYSPSRGSYSTSLKEEYSISWLCWICFEILPYLWTVSSLKWLVFLLLFYELFFFTSRSLLLALLSACMRTRLSPMWVMPIYCFSKLQFIAKTHIKLFLRKIEINKFYLRWRCDIIVDYYW